MPRRDTPPKWSQPSLMPVWRPLVVLREHWVITSDGQPVMSSYWVEDEQEKPTKLAGGIDWLQDLHDPEQRAEILHDHFRIALEHLPPF